MLYICSIYFQIKKIPQPCSDNNNSSGSNKVNTPIQYDPLNQTDDDGLKIAWRYNALPKVDAEQKVSNQGHSFDLTKLITEDSLNELKITLFDSLPNNSFGNIFINCYFGQLLNSIKTAIAPITAQEQKNLLRISISSLGSPLWYDKNYTKELCLFLTMLKAIVRNSLAVCCITMPMHLVKHHVSIVFFFFI